MSRISGKPYLKLVPSSDGPLIVGRDPTTMTTAELLESGLVPRTPEAAIREQCRFCAGGRNQAIDDCADVKCPLWPFRMKSNPWKGARGKR